MDASHEAGAGGANGVRREDPHAKESKRDDGAGLLPAQSTCGQKHRDHAPLQLRAALATASEVRSTLAGDRSHSRSKPAAAKPSVKRTGLKLPLASQESHASDPAQRLTCGLATLAPIALPASLVLPALASLGLASMALNARSAGSYLLA